MFEKCFFGHFKEVKFCTNVLFGSCLLADRSHRFTHKFPEATMRLLLLFLAFCFSGIHVISSSTHPDDANALQSLRQTWSNIPPSWDKSNDPCGEHWEGITCNGSRVTALELSGMNVKGKFEGDIGGLSELRSLVLSFNKGLTGSLSPRLGDLSNLSILVLAGCSFSGTIPSELGKLGELTFLALNTNSFTGSIPASLGNLSKLYWLDLAYNQLTGPLPVSSGTTPGLDQLFEARHFHLNHNQLSGTIPPTLFSSKMQLIHVLFDGNRFTGAIPSTIFSIQSLEVLRLDRNALTGPVSSNISNLINLSELNFAHNNLDGALPNLTGLNALNYVDLSNNSFDQSEAPLWISTLRSVTTIVLENVALQGTLPRGIFRIPSLKQVKLKNNAFSGTFNMGDNISPQLTLVDLQNNKIEEITPGYEYKNTLILVGNPLCNKYSLSSFCQPPQSNTKRYATSTNCASITCPGDQQPSPRGCKCGYPFEGTLDFLAPPSRDLTNVTLFKSLETILWEKLNLTPHSVSLKNPCFDIDDHLKVHVALFPPTGTYFNRSEIIRIGLNMSHQIQKPPDEFGPFNFIAAPYNFPDTHKSSMITVWILVSCLVLVVGLVVVGIYAIRQKKRAERAIGLSRPFASWAPSGNDSGGAPQLKGARWFSYEELKRCTNNFSDSNEIGSGSYGKVYRAMLSDGQVIAIKRAQQGSMQGGLEFKTEVELLSRVHHKNVVGLLGFCFEQGEQMLVYEFMPNGTLRESLSGRSGIHLDWKRRLRITLGSARGLAYLHELANPPIIHRDVKSTNILLDEHLTAKVADFGLSKLVNDSGKGHVSTQVKGTMGYLDPEYYMTQQLTEKSDVYSFGVVMLELITARHPIEKGKYIVREVQLVMDKNDEEHYGLRELIDRNIRNSGTLIGFGRFLELAMQCVEESAADRPMMSEVVKAIETILQNDGMNTNSTSASSSATGFAASKGAPKHPYNDGLPKKEFNDSTGSFDYSSGHIVSAKIEPK
ncbi:leucine-rich repeat receptor-like protein kinase [Pyrus ussuriensis x Pyrus communis]|uniref:non-specific serine/threonine protein kinase n=1 Tax=Pyrus ussuriensis x Pyrus communis TaxID=2448454 RepID=A0A5N5H8K5_9ROSA|nr:leucine-rich repeat receptor-like protein kinase [Pyrus ussuriensis x Pyrus communis]